MCLFRMLQKKTWAEVLHKRVIKLSLECFMSKKNSNPKLGLTTFTFSLVNPRGHANLQTILQVADYWELQRWCLYYIFCLEVIPKDLKETFIDLCEAYIEKKMIHKSIMYT